MTKFFLFFICLSQCFFAFGQGTKMLYQKNRAIPNTQHEKILIRHIKASIKKSARLESKLAEKKFENILSAEKWRNDCVLSVHNNPLKDISKLSDYHLLNNLCSLPNASHLHIGLLAGDSFIAALYGNQSLLDQQIGIDWFQECSEDVFHTNCNCFLEPRTYEVINSGCFNVDKSVFKKPIDIYFYDADHSIIGQQNAFIYFNDILADIFIIMIDDWDCPWIRSSTFKAFDKLNYSILYEYVTDSNYRGKKKCQYLAVIRKTIFEMTEVPGLELVNNSNQLNKQKANVFKTIKGGWCSAEKSALIMDVICQTSPQVCVEIGTFTGSSFFPIVSALSINGQGHAYAIDAWSNKEAIKGIPRSKHYDWWAAVNMEQAYTTCNKTLSDPKLSRYFTIIRSSSAVASSRFDTIDFLHLDGSFSERGALEDVELYLPKVKSGGYILLSNAFFSINNKFFKTKALCTLIEQCDEVIAEIDNNNTILFRK